MLMFHAAANRDRCPVRKRSDQSVYSISNNEQLTQKLWMGLIIDKFE